MNEKILQLHTEGLTNRAIAKKLDCHHNTVAYWLKKKGFSSNGNCRVPIDRVDAKHIRCSKCKEVKDHKQFLYNRKGKKYEYQFTYCLECRKNQLNANLNSDVSKFLGDRYNRLRIRAKKKKIVFEITRKQFLALYEKQKGKCFYTDIEMIWGAGKGKNRNSLSVDKIVPEKGYIHGNVVLCLNKVNTAKNDITLNEMKEWMPGWYKRVIEM